MICHHRSQWTSNSSSKIALAISGPGDIRQVLKMYKGTDIPRVFAENQRKFYEARVKNQTTKPSAGILGRLLRAKVRGGIPKLMTIRGKTFMIFSATHQYPLRFREGATTQVFWVHSKCALETSRMEKRSWRVTKSSHYASRKLCLIKLGYLSPRAKYPFFLFL